MCTVLYANAFSLEPAEDCFFFGAEWDPQDNEQAEDRLLSYQKPELRIGAHYFCYENTADEYLTDRLVNWNEGIQQTMSLGAFRQKFLPKEK
jgi:hypothetical protein